MKRWVRSSSMAAALACAGWSVAQGPQLFPATPAASPSPQAGGPQEGDIIVMRTAGQAERRVKVMRIASFDDGEVLADVQDQSSGEKFSLPLRSGVSPVPQPVAAPTSMSPVSASPMPASPNNHRPAAARYPGATPPPTGATATTRTPSPASTQQRPSYSAGALAAQPANSPARSVSPGAVTSAPASTGTANPATKPRTMWPKWFDRKEEPKPETDTTIPPPSAMQALAGQNRPSARPTTAPTNRGASFTPSPTPTASAPAAKSPTVAVRGPGGYVAMPAATPLPTPVPLTKTPPPDLTGLSASATRTPTVQAITTPPVVSATPKFIPTPTVPAPTPAIMASNFQPRPSAAPTPPPVASIATPAPVIAQVSATIPAAPPVPAPMPVIMAPVTTSAVSAPKPVAVTPPSSPVVSLPSPAAMPTVAVTPAVTVAPPVTPAAPTVPAALASTAATSTAKAKDSLFSVTFVMVNAPVSIGTSTVNNPTTTTTTNVTAPSATDPAPTTPATVAAPESKVAFTAAASRVRPIPARVPGELPVFRAASKPVEPARFSTTVNVPAGTTIPVPATPLPRIARTVAPIPTITVTSTVVTASHTVSVPAADLPQAADIRPYLIDLFTALRPSIREAAATGLAEGLHNSRMQVKVLLAQAAMADAAPSVRAHCIRCLSKLKYDDAVYVAYLKACEAGNDADVQVAAKTALTLLAAAK